MVMGLRATSHTSQETRPWNCESPIPKAIPRHLQNHVVWSQILKCGVKSYVTGSPTKCYFNKFLFMQVLTHDKIEWMNSCEHLECHGLPILCQVYLQEVVFNSPSDNETWSIRCHVGIHVNSYIHLAFTYSIGPSGVVGSKLGPAPPFPPMSVLEV